MSTFAVTWSGASSVSGAAAVDSDIVSTAGSIGFSAVIEATGSSGGLSGNLCLLVGNAENDLTLLAGSVRSVLLASGQSQSYAWSEATFYAYAAIGWVPGSENSGTLNGTWQVVSLVTPPVIVPPTPPIPGPPGGINVQDDTQQLAVNRLRQRLKLNATTAKPNVSALLQVLCNQCDALESTLQAMFYYRQLDNAYGIMLDNIGAIVGFARPPSLPTPTGDATYQLYLKAKIVADFSSGRTEDLNRIFALLVPAGVTFSVNWQYTAAFMIYLTDPAGVLTQAEINVYAQFMRTARAAGVRGVLEYSINTPDSELLTFMSATDTFDVNGSGPTNQGIGLDQGYFRGATN